jgi:aspartate carbamoyltransferase catalytic subunit
MASISYNHEQSSSKKGESLRDTIKIIDGYCDAIAIRHPSEGAARLAADVASAPVINAGDGSNQHPTQTLIDLYAIKKSKGKFEGLNVSLVGDLKFGRTTRSLSYALAMLGANVHLICVPGLEMSPDVISEIEEKFGSKITQSQKFDISDADVVYMTRIQSERFDDKYLAKRLQENYALSKKILQTAKKEMIIMHPLPRLSEIPDEIDSSPHAYYFEQAKCGVPVRMAVLHDCLSK